MIPTKARSSPTSCDSWRACATGSTSEALDVSPFPHFVGDRSGGKDPSQHVYSIYIYIRYTIYILYIYTIYIHYIYTHYIYTIYILYIYYIYTIYTLYIYTLYIYTIYIHYIYTIYILHTIYIHTLYIYYFHAFSIYSIDWYIHIIYIYHHMPWISQGLTADISRFRQLPAVHRCSKPTRPDKARAASGQGRAKKMGISWGLLRSKWWFHGDFMVISWWFHGDCGQ